MRQYLVAIGNGDKDKVSSVLFASSAAVAVNKALREYEKARKEHGRPVRKSLAGEGIRIFVRYA